MFLRHWLAIAVAFGSLSCRATNFSSAPAGSGGGGSSPPVASFGTDFFFGIATAPAHVEDQLDDIWLEFAQDGSKNGVKAWRNAGHPELRLKFWTQYKTEVDLAKRLGVKVFRMGVDWGRLVPTQPANTCPGEAEICPAPGLDPVALAHYQEIVRYVRSQGMAVMMTLFHHSPPKWLSQLNVDHAGKKNMGGWTNPDAIPYFESFSRSVAEAFKSDVDLWVIFNEPAVFAALAYGAGIWPPAQGMNFLAMFKVGSLEGATARAIDHMVAAHNRVYKAIKTIDTVTTADSAVQGRGPAYVGIAHNVGYQTSRGPIGKLIANYLRGTMNYRFIDGVINSLDFLGLNYYGEEIVSAAGVPPVPDKEYSESGRAVNPQGFYLTLKAFSDRYFKQRKIPIIITENGISDSTDLLRPAYLVEHLLAVDAARADGLPIIGYVFWTLSDNWEWADGYCPKFGLVGVDRSTPALARSLRPSFGLYRDIIATGRITTEQRDRAWGLVTSNVGRARPFCRSADGKNSLDVPGQRNIINLDWRFRRPDAAPTQNH